MFSAHNQQQLLELEQHGLPESVLEVPEAYLSGLHHSDARKSGHVDGLEHIESNGVNLPQRQENVVEWYSSN